MAAVKGGRLIIEDELIDAHLDWLLRHARILKRRESSRHELLLVYFVNAACSPK